MKSTIRKMEVFGVDMPLAGTFTSAGIAKNVTKCVVIRLTADTGAIGISSIEPSAQSKSPGTAPELAAALRDKIAPALIGQDASYGTGFVCRSEGFRRPSSGAQNPCTTSARVHGSSNASG